MSEVNADSTNWRAIRVAIERVEGHLDDTVVTDAIKIVKERYDEICRIKKADLAELKQNLQEKSKVLVLFGCGLLSNRIAGIGTHFRG